MRSRLPLPYCNAAPGASQSHHLYTLRALRFKGRVRCTFTIRTPKTLAVGAPTCQAHEALRSALDRQRETFESGTFHVSIVAVNEWATNKRMRSRLPLPYCNAAPGASQFLPLRTLRVLQPEDDVGIAAQAYRIVATCG